MKTSQIVQGQWPRFVPPVALPGAGETLRAGRQQGLGWTDKGVAANLGPVALLHNECGGGRGMRAPASLSAGAVRRPGCPGTQWEVGRGRPVSQDVACSSNALEKDAWTGSLHIEFCSPQSNMLGSWAFGVPGLTFPIEWPWISGFCP